MSFTMTFTITFPFPGLEKMIAPLLIALDYDIGIQNLYIVTHKFLR
jgi:hypothetical protein